MEDFVQKCGKWLEFQGTIKEMNRNINVSIVLEEDSIFRCLIVFKVKNEYLGIFPVNTCIFTKLDLNEVIIYFNLQKSVFQMTLNCPSTRIATIFQSQITTLFGISKLDNNLYYEQNITFLKQNAIQIPNFNEKEEYKNMNNYRHPLFPIDETDALETWRRRSNKINTQFYSEFQDFKVKVYTWNVAQIQPNDDTFQWAQRIFQGNADFIMITLQEIDFSIGAVVFGSSALLDIWNNVFIKACGENDYQSIFSNSIGGVYVNFFKRKSFTEEIKIIDQRLIKLGFGGFTANKSAIFTKISIGLSVFNFVGCHLAPFNEGYEERNQQVQLLLKIFEEMGDSDFYILSGDLNYRVDISYEEAVEMSNNNELQALLEKEQLYKYKKENEDFNQFHEEPITFKPTYRFDMGNNIYDTSIKRRIPSWTDRVLVKVGKKRLTIGFTDTFNFETDIIYHIDHYEFLKGKSYFTTQEQVYNYPEQPICESYFSHQDVVYSDHRPVDANYIFKIPRIDEERKKIYIEERDKKIDEILLLLTPRCKIVPNSFEMNRFAEITIKNISFVSCKWSIESVSENIKFIPNSDELFVNESKTIKIESSLKENKSFIITINVKDGVPAFFEMNCKCNETD